MTATTDLLRRAADILAALADPGRAVCGSISDISADAASLLALAAMPDDLLRQLCAERGCVMVPKNPTEAMLDAMYRPWDMLDNELREMWAEILAASDPRQQTLDRMAENAQELGLYGKEKGDE